MSFQIAIDGPVAAGCSTVARLVAERLGFLYIDTGAMYRTAALLAMRNNINLEDEVQLVELVRKSKIELRKPTIGEKDGRLITILLNGEDTSWQIRTDEISRNTPVVAKHRKLREVLVEKQQQIAAHDDVVMEGRDITYKVLPDADLKIFMTASDVIRAKRRHMQMQSRGKDLSFEDTYQELLKRDKIDTERSVDPLKKVDEAMVVDTSDLTINQAVNMIEAQVRAIKEIKL
ncbi:MAG: (d)CMP kinase [Candidatus Pacebacteria bacterium]|jgi:CMP/dCMP kinase|nr:(d)CMP kinase [Candidatus Paceibacterota bacterium]MBT3511621.1 (d)CMP kinase [Candidatus Paceibacterota bacterium]MBT4004710.1 (d)CMP kinase [Candidatus Paceibacterota bacterium]MBT4359248.1 (d)CMP kinase [Candidatus Paceibacterota bacterium]MBT4681028.1 (d)CMP kinase [Candidatus Paceibacterota bacterium]